MAHEDEFPRFDCLITGRQEEYDSEIARYFIAQDHLASMVSELFHTDEDWSENYLKILSYLKSLEEFVITGGSIPSYDFLVELSLVDDLEYDSYDLLLRTPNSIPALIYRATVAVRDLMYWYVRLSRNAAYSKNFRPDAFKGLPFLRLALSYRAVHLVESR